MANLLQLIYLNPFNIIKYKYYIVIIFLIVNIN